MSTVRRVQVVVAAAVMLVAVMLVALLTAPRQRPSIALREEANAVADRIATVANTSAASQAPISIVRLKEVATNAIAGYPSHDQLIVVVGGDRVVVRGILTGGGGDIATATIMKVAGSVGAKSSPLGYVYVIGAASDRRQLATGRVIVLVLLTVALFGLVIALVITKARGGTTLAEAALREEAAADRREAASLREELLRLQERESHSHGELGEPTTVVDAALREEAAADRREAARLRKELLILQGQENESHRERGLLVRECIAIADATPDERVARRIGEALQQAGVEVLAPATGERFDPSRHHIAATIPAARASQRRTIHAVVRPGYVDHGDLVRPADVATYAAPVDGR